MRGYNQKYKSLFAVLLFVFGVMTLYAVNVEEAPRFILFFGRFHPLLLHLPIGALVVTFFIDVLGRIQKNYQEQVIKYLLGFTALFSVATCFLGYFLSLESGYEEETLDLHFYTGIGTAVLVSVLSFMSLKSDFKSKALFLPLFIATLIGISVAGHFGSVLTHGENFLTEYAGIEPKERTIEVVDSLKLYDDVVVKILDDKCIQCHNATKQKGALSLISPEEILRGGESGKSIIAGNASQSLLYSQLLLPLSDDAHMPPEGKAQLTKDERWLIHHWINQGADFGKYVEGISENDTLRQKLERYLVFDEVVIPKASESAIEEVKAAGFRVHELVPGKSALHVKLLDENPSEESMEALLSIQEQVVELDMGHAKITDPMTRVFKKFENLKSLQIHSQDITDLSLENVKSLERLEVLNMYGTSISEKGLSGLLKVIRPQNIYVWKTELTQEEASLLEKEFKVNIHHNITEGFVSNSQLEMPLVSPDKTLFRDTIHIAARSRIKDVTLHYTTDGSAPDNDAPVFDEALILDDSKIIKIAAFKEGWVPSKVLVREYAKIEHQVSSFSIKNQPDERYPDAQKLFDLEEGSTSFKDGKWTGFFGTDIQATIDLGAIQALENISFRCMEDVGSWILYPTHFTVYVSDTKNGDFKRVGQQVISREGEGGEVAIKKVNIEMAGTQGRYVKIHIKNHKTLPAWHPSAGNPSWLFVDEIYLW